MSTRIAASATMKNAPSPMTISAPLCTLECLQPVLVELDAQAGLVRHVEIPIAVDLKGLREHEVAVLRGPVRRVVRELDERAVGDGGRELEVRCETEAVRPGVRCEEQSGRFGHAGDFLRDRDAAREGAVRLINVE